jgi:hypothetical protein
MLYEYYNTNDDVSIGYATSGTWIAQTFTVGAVGTNENHTINMVKLKLNTNGANPGTINVLIQGVDGSNKPDGNTLASGSADASGVGVSPGSWLSVLLGAGTTLSVSTQYAIVTYQTGGTANHLMWRQDNAGATYAGGMRNYSTDSGSTWAQDSSRDMMFEEWVSEQVIDEGTKTVTGTLSTTLPTEAVAISEGTKDVLSIFSTVLSSESFSTSLTPARPTDYSGEYVWGYYDGEYQWIDAAVGVDILAAGGGRYKTILIAVGHKTIYFGEI